MYAGGPINSTRGLTEKFAWSADFKLVRNKCSIVFTRYDLKINKIKIKLRFELLLEYIVLL